MPEPGFGKGAVRAGAAALTEEPDEPLPVAAFRRIATQYVPTIKEIDGVTYFRGVLPDMRKESAA